MSIASGNRQSASEVFCFQRREDESSDYDNKFMIWKTISFFMLKRALFLAIGVAILTVGLVKIIVVLLEVSNEIWKAQCSDII